MKARDIIPGWPRPKSTIVFRDWEYPRWWFASIPAFLIPRLIYLDAEGTIITGAEREAAIEQTRLDIEKCKAEFEANRSYHEAQERMVDDFRSGKSSPFVLPTRISEDFKLTAWLIP